MIDKKTLARMNKKTGDELQGYLHFKKRGSCTKAKKGKGSYDRRSFKDERSWQKDDYCY